MTQNNPDRVPEANFGNPTPPAPALPAGLRRSLIDFLGKDDGLAAIRFVSEYWPRPAPVTADARELWDRAFDAYRNGMGDATAHERAAAVLAPVVARAVAAEAAQAAAERTVAEAVREAQGPGSALYRAIVAKLAPHLPRDTRDLEWDVLPSTVGGIAAERDQLRAEVEEWKRLEAACGKALEDNATAHGQHTERLHKRIAELRAEMERLKTCPTCQSTGEGMPCAYPTETAKALRAQLAAAQAQAREAMEDKERLDWLEANAMGSFAFGGNHHNSAHLSRWGIDTARSMLDAARREGGGHD